MSDYEDFMFVDAEDERIYDQNVEARRVLMRIDQDRAACVKNRGLKRKREDEKENEKIIENETNNKILSENSLKLERVKKSRNQV